MRSTSRTGIGQTLRRCVAMGIVALIAAIAPPARAETGQDFADRAGRRLVGRPALESVTALTQAMPHNRRASSATMSGSSSGQNSFLPASRSTPRELPKVRSR